MKLCVGTSKGIVIVDSRPGAALEVISEPSSVWCLAQDSRDRSLIYAGKAGHSGLGYEGASALCRSIDGGRSWTDIAPAAMKGEEVWALATSPDEPGAVYAGTSHGRLFRSVDGGDSFAECAAFLKVPGREHWSFPPPPHIPHVRSISFDPRDPAVVYIGVEEGGIFRSRDRGASFESLNEGLYDDIHTVRVDPHDSRRLYATTGRGFYLSDNDGASWRYVAQGVTRRYTVPLFVADGGDVRVYTAAAAGAPPSWTGEVGADAQLFVSRDRGLSFDTIPTERLPRGPMIMRLMQDPEGGLFGTVNNGSLIHVDGAGEKTAIVAEGLPPAYDMVIVE